MPVTWNAVSVTKHAWLVFASVGALVCCVHCVILLIHILLDYCKKFPSVSLNPTLFRSSSMSEPFVKVETPKKKQANKQTYHLMICYLILSLLLCLCISLIRSNIITHQKHTKYTDIQCAIGYFSHYSLLVISKAFMYNLFNYRIQIIFDNTAYAFNKTIYILMYIIPWYNVLFVITCLYIGQFVENKETLDWRLYINDPSYIVFCGGTLNFRFAIKLFIIHSGVIEVIMSLTLLYMFSHRLYKLYTTLLQQHVKEYLLNYDYDDNDDVELQNISMDNADDNCGKGSEERQSIQRVVGSRNIIKKQTILLFIALGSSIVYWILAMVYPLMSLQSGWEVMVNVTCTWLMFGCTRPVWDCLTKYFFCKFCY